MNKQIFFIVAIFILALALRSNMAGYDNFFEYDQAWEARINREVLLNGELIRVEERQKNTQRHLWPSSTRRDCK